MDKVRDIAQLIRWQNLLMIAILMWVMEKWVAVPLIGRYEFEEVMPWYILLMLILSTVLVAAGGYVINDYFDIKIDRINRPDDVIVGERIDKKTAMRLSISLTAVGVVMGMTTAGLIGSWALGIVYVLTPGLLWFYSSTYKRQLIVGNLIVSFLTAMVPMLIAFANASILRIYLADIVPIFEARGMTLDWENTLYAWLGGFALMAFLYTWMREIIKDMQDEMGDRELECRTMPIKWGFVWSKVTVTVIAIGVCALLVWLHMSVLPFDHSWSSLATRYLIFGILTPLGCALWLMWAAKIPSDYLNAQRVMKFAMFLGMLYAFVIHKQLCI